MVTEDRNKVATELTRRLHQLSLLAPQQSLTFLAGRNNDAYSDEETIFCKVLPLSRGDVVASMANELRFVADFAHVLPTFRFLAGRPIVFMVEGVKRYASIWLWDDTVRTLSPQQLDTDIAHQMASKLHDIHNLPVKTWMPAITYDALAYTVELRLAHGKMTGASRTHMLLLEELFKRFIRPSDFAFTNMVPNHGDCHVKNFVSVQGELRWTDFESIRIAPREWDIANMSLMTKRVAGKPELWDSILSVFEASKPVNEERMRFFETLKAISSTSYSLMHPSSAQIFEQQVESLAPLLEGGSLPDRFIFYLPTVP